MSDEQQPAPTTAIDARTRLDGLMSDKAWADRFLAGDVAANREFTDLTELSARNDDSTVAAALAGNAGEIPNSAARIMSGTAGMLRDLGIGDEVIRQTLESREVTQAEYDATKAWQTRTMKDQFWVKAYLDGDPDARRQMMLASIILSSSIKGQSARA